MKCSSIQNPIILFGNGQPPIHPIELKALKEANTIICVDGGANRLEKLGFEADYILGDMDSITDLDNWVNSEKIILEDQSMTDLEKALNWCLQKRISQLTIIGFSGLRDDHHQIGFLVLSTFSSQIKIEMLTNFSTIYCVDGYQEFNCTPNQMISLIPNYYLTKIQTAGLKYPLNNEKLQYTSQGVSNSTIENLFSINTNGPVWVILNHPE